MEEVINAINEANRILLSTFQKIGSWIDSVLSSGKDLLKFCAELGDIKNYDMGNAVINGMFIVLVSIVVIKFIKK